MDINIVIMTGRITREPEIKYFDSGSNKTSFSIATNKWNSKDKTEVAQFFNCEVWGKQATFLAEYGQKGNQITIQGTLENSNYEVDGVKKTRTFIKVENFTLPKQTKTESEPKADSEPEF